MSRSNTSDPSLVQACLDGSQQAWNELVDRYERLVYSVALKSRLSAADADDVFQTVFFSLHRNLPQLKDQARLSAWLITTTHRESWRVARRRMRTLGDDNLDSESAVIDPRELETIETQTLVRQGLAELGGTCEQLLRMLFMDSDETPYDNIASQLGMAVGSIGPTRARCLKKLERILARLGLAGNELSSETSEN